MMMASPPAADLIWSCSCLQWRHGCATVVPFHIPWAGKRREANVLTTRAPVATPMDCSTQDITINAVVRPLWLKLDRRLTGWARREFCVAFVTDLRTKRTSYAFRR